MARIPIALQLYSVREDCDKDLPGVLSAVAKMGYEGVEGGAPSGMSNKEFVALLKDHNLKLASSGASTAELQDDLQKVVDRCGELGTNLLMIGIGGEIRQSGGDWKGVVAKLGESCAKAAEA